MGKELVMGRRASISEVNSLISPGVRGRERGRWEIRRACRRVGMKLDLQ